MRFEVLLAALGQFGGTIFRDAVSGQASEIVMAECGRDARQAGKKAEILGLIAEIYLLGIVGWKLRHVVVIHAGHVCGVGCGVLVVSRESEHHARPKIKIA